MPLTFTFFWNPTRLIHKFPFSWPFDLFDLGIDLYERYFELKYFFSRFSTPIAFIWAYDELSMMILNILPGWPWPVTFDLRFRVLRVIFQLGTISYSIRHGKMVLSCEFRVFGIKPTVGHLIFTFLGKTSWLLQQENKLSLLVPTGNTGEGYLLAYL